MSKYGLHGKLKATKGNGAQLAAILLQASELVSKAKGCNLYIISKDKEDEEMFWVTEIWESKEDHHQSLKTEGAAELVLQALPIIDGNPKSGREFEIIGGFGLR